MKTNDYIQAAIPLFFVLIFLEALFSNWAKKNWFNLHDSLNNLACGALDQILEVFYKSALFGVYLWLYSYRLTSLSETALWVWLLCFLGVDFGYYWFHRCSHRVWLVWAGHGPHHQSEEYNLTVALRQGMLERSFSWVFTLPLALLGFSPVVYLTCSQFQIIYQFFIHTRAIKTLGPLEWVMNTPSHHRVHHGKNPEYIDRNYGGVLIIWDRLFGSFEPERKEAVYGTVKALKSWNPLWAHAVFFAEMAQAMRSLPWHQKLQVLWRPPGWNPQQAEPEIPPVEAQSYLKYKTPLDWGINLWLLLQFGICLGLSTLFLEQAPQWEMLQGIGAGLSLMLGFTAVGALNENKAWLTPFETVRILLSLGVMILLPFPLLLKEGLSLWLLLSAALNLGLLQTPQFSKQNPAQDPQSAG
ncbi:sterol desaturase family protein [bacterium (Candidatus Blackallbacteria) CG17_big_fil_post_rev_8_21_14_2_50_48_46]|uniref:Sterol desaturase family protein n=1 Tax=bacterium (Candidatus Blackallbacteria) CG17_big_fil_post_rev_8_21_14_2_50_48_46 TaxID=2014261 RepID=A0A2M7G2X5_9BACT|nr:MAG: sterol desaturase [bacterium (Candidatus Blackallbacteria) CG18_big_fil_WC_8_21_14_2_50_49_26]PIW15770.1 MAG: sterol desaturase family protein [bacterium (Candidatus Blackallbacteria) CG17_big_fil_post_rev_8_21_14_2_50_48_46]PIW48732.1 MAG: sterol desaturase family protein [bacterium (Candidatus Blackallbacteria) CG13_big_fil_rev_8_21_14_2_50_49_14]